VREKLLPPPRSRRRWREGRDEAVGPVGWDRTLDFEGVGLADADPLAVAELELVQVVDPGGGQHVEDAPWVTGIAGLVAPDDGIVPLEC